MRIRSIKPDFWRDEKIASLKNKIAGYFFIALWNIADDEGKFQLNAKGLHLEAPIFRTKEIVIYLSELSQKGLIMKSECSQWGLITNWDHQKIDRPRLPKVKKEEIQWVTQGHSSKPRESSSNVRRKDRIGKDRIGSIAPVPPLGGGTHTPTDLLSAWNQNRGSLPKALGLSPDRTRSAKARIKEEPDLNVWVSLIKRIAASRFCTGQTGGDWRASFEWLLRPGTRLKILEGKYDDRPVEDDKSRFPEMNASDGH